MTFFLHIDIKMYIFFSIWSSFSLSLYKGGGIPSLSRHWWANESNDLNYNGDYIQTFLFYLEILLTLRLSFLFLSFCYLISTNLKDIHPYFKNGKQTERYKHTDGRTNGYNEIRKSHWHLQLRWAINQQHTCNNCFFLIVQQTTNVSFGDENK